ncbi:MAG: histidinol phosphatase [Actinobacteria bacterium]|nr:histidinol phosphatase [Actinomycetota bacterium]
MDELAFAGRLADMADEITMRYFNSQLKISTKKDGSIVTQADRETEETIRAAIQKQYPNHAILGEESGLQGDTSSPTWVIDPIDGTNNYAAGIPVFATLIALRIDGITEVGVVSAPALQERYEAATDAGARMNDHPIHVSEVSALAGATVCIGSYHRMVRYGFGEQLAYILANCRRDRGFGDFWGHMLVARGAAEAMVEPNLKIWDIAALEVIVKEAGGRASGFGGDPYPESRMTSGGADGSLMSTNGKLHQEFMDILGG